MVALRFPPGPDDAQPEAGLPKPDPGDWLTLQQAACELNISISTARRLIRKGKLRNRIVPRRGGFAYLIYLPNSRHARGLAGHACNADDEHAGPQRNGNGHAAHAADPVPLQDVRLRDRQIRELEQQVEHLSDALARALKVRQRQLPQGIGAPDTNPNDPYARYRWLARRRRWWPFS